MTSITKRLQRLKQSV